MKEGLFSRGRTCLSSTDLLFSSSVVEVWTLTPSCCYKHTTVRLWFVLLSVCMQAGITHLRRTSPASHPPKLAWEGAEGGGEEGAEEEERWGQEAPF